jgi:hypothetical protein
MLIIIWKRFNMFRNRKRLLNFHTCSLQSLNMCTSCHTAHIQPIDNFLPDSLQHIRCYSSRSDHSSILQLLQIPRQWWQVDNVFRVAAQEEIAVCEVRWPGWPPRQRIVIGSMASDPSLKKRTIQNSANLPIKTRLISISLEDVAIRILIIINKITVI